MAKGAVTATTPDTASTSGGRSNLKASRIRQIITQNPHFTGAQVVEAFGGGVTANYVYMIKSKMKPRKPETAAMNVAQAVLAITTAKNLLQLLPLGTAIDLVKTLGE